MKNGTHRGLCNQPWCKRLRRKDRCRCHTHDTRRKRKANPMRYAFQTLRSNAKRRQIPFRLSFKTFSAFALASDYLNKKGNGKHCLTVDRINNLRGYDKNNIQPLTRAANREKQAKVDAHRMKAGMKWSEN